uniref:Uncharacterized protein n=1 Tax=viral metagenome TaxID=1070528 RepID=A0A6C0DHI9_9ZZZZ
MGTQVDAVSLRWLFDLEFRAVTGGKGELNENGTGYSERGSRELWAICGNLLGGGDV